MWWPDGRGPAAGLALAAALAAAGCGFAPLHGGGAAAEAALGRVRIAPIADRPGQALRNQLLLRINPRGQPADPEYVLKVELAETRRDLGLRVDAAATRVALAVRARYALTGTADGREVARGAVEAAGGYDVLDSAFATLKAESDTRSRALRVLADEIAARLALALRAGR